MNIVEMDEKRILLWRMYVTMALPTVLKMVTAMVYSAADTWSISATGNTALTAEPS